VQWGIFSFEEREAGANIVIRDMRYMWSEMDSPLRVGLAHLDAAASQQEDYLVMPNLRQPSRLVSLRRSSIWKNGTGESEFVTGGPPGRVARIVSTDHCGVVV
jgi:hypothetical protein